MTVQQIAVAGSSGRMGRSLIEAIAQSHDFRLKAALEIPGNECLGRDAGELVGRPCGVLVTAHLDDVLPGCDVLVDFTRPEGTLNHVDLCRRMGIKMVIGTTGLQPAQKAVISDAAKTIAIVMAPNMSVGVNLTFKLAELAAKVLKEDYDVEIIEAHHRLKIDAPSGTALLLGEVIAAALGRDLGKDAIFGREGVTGERKQSSIGFATVRGGDIVGDHTAMFAGIGERVEITHRAASRATFAQGALRAARYLASKNSGLYDMQDVLGLK
jgi:4-hydroxy-tetrahydrodipicolinate reductase